MKGIDGIVLESNVIDSFRKGKRKNHRHYFVWIQWMNKAGYF